MSDRPEAKRAALDRLLEPLPPEHAREIRRAADDAIAAEIAEFRNLGAPNGRAAETKTETYRAAVSPALRITSDAILDGIQPQVESIRHRLFGDSAAPFTSFKAAADWIQGERSRVDSIFRDMAAELARDEAEQTRWLALAAASTGGARQLAPLIALHVDQQLQEALGPVSEVIAKYGLIHRHRVLHHPTVSYKTRATGWREELVIPRNDRLAPLAAYGAGLMGASIEQLVRATGLRPEDLTMHCLVRKYRPVLAPASISWKTRHGPLDRTSVTIEFNAGDLSFDELRRLYNRYRRGMNLQRRKKLDDDSAHLLELVKRQGGVPPKGQVAFFKKLYKRHYRESTRVRSWEALYKRYRRLQERLPIHNHEGGAR